MGDTVLRRRIFRVFMRNGVSFSVENHHFHRSAFHSQLFVRNDSETRWFGVGEERVGVSIIRHRA